MALVNCSHGKTCYIKTSTKPGPNKGRSFYICGPNTTDRCDFVQEARIPVMLCPQHPGKWVDLQSFSSKNSKNELRRYFRCTVGRETGGSWCGHVLVEIPEALQKENPNSVISRNDQVIKKTNPEEFKEVKKPLGDHRLAPNIISNFNTAEFKPVHKKDVSELLQTKTDRQPSVAQSTQRSHSEKSVKNEHQIPQSTQRSHSEKSVDKVQQVVRPKTNDMRSLGSLGAAANIISNMGKRRESTIVINSDNDDDDDDEDSDDECFIIGKPQTATDEKKKSDHEKVDRTKASSSEGDEATIHVPDETQRDAIKQQLKRELNLKRELYKKVDVSTLPDKGERIKTQIRELEKAIAGMILDEMKTKKDERTVSQKVLVSSDDKPVVQSTDKKFVTLPRQTQILPHAVPLQPAALKQMYAANPQAMTLYGGRMTKDRLMQVGAVTTDALERLHKQLETCPNENTESEDPNGLKVQLMSHQRQAIAWLQWREQQEPAGGILADDMGLGKTLTMISLILKHKEKNSSDKDDESEWLSKQQELKKVNRSLIASRATLVIAPASLIHQWNKEIENRCDDGKLKVLIYHGPKRDKDPRKLAKYDVVLTTYSIISKEVGALTDADGKKVSAEESVKDEQTGENEPGLLRVAWERIILDEGHNIKNHKSLTAMSVCRLRAAHRWVLTGTPIQNDLLDMYSLLRFLRCSPFDEFKVWKKQVEMRTGQGTKRLNILIKSLLLRRTKNQTTNSGKPLVSLPEKQVVNHELTLSADEQAVYDKIFSQSKNMLQEYLQKQADKERERTGITGPNSYSSKPSLPHPGSNHLAGALTLKQSGSSTNGGSQILLLLLRLRQACCHLSLLKDAFDMDVLQDEGLDVTMEQQLDLLSLNDPKEPKVDLNSLFETKAVSTKITMLIDKIREIKKRSPSKKPEKSVIVSQWTKMLEIVATHLKKEGIRYHLIQGNIAPKLRQDMVENFNHDDEGPEVMLLSLRAGGVGLNLIGGNNLFIMDIHWNPALEAQACDRIYRVGQKKEVFIHRFVCKDTVEDKIVALQKKKTDLANNVLTGAGAKRQKLSLNDLKMLFGLDDSPNHRVPTYSSSNFIPPGAVRSYNNVGATSSYNNVGAVRSYNNVGAVRPYNNVGATSSYNNAPFKPPTLNHQSH